MWFYECSHWPLNVSSIMEILLPTKSTPRSPPPTPSLWVVVLCVSFPSFPHSSYFSPSLCPLSLHQPALFKLWQASVYSSALLLTEKLALKKPQLFIILIWPTHTLLNVCVGLRDPIPSSTFHTVCLMIQRFVQTAVLEMFNLVKADILWLLQNLFSSLVFSSLLLSSLLFSSLLRQGI